MARMSARLLLVLLLIALIPARAVGSVTISLCAGEAATAASEQAMHASHGAQDGHEHDAHEHGAPGPESAHACGYCAAHCSGVAFVAPADPRGASAEGASGPIPFGTRALTAVTLDRLDRPPLAS